MANSIKYWYDVMIAEKQSMSNLQNLQPNIDNSQNLLNDLNTTSRVGVWRLLIWVVATCAYAMEVVFDLFKKDLEEISKNSRFGTLPWYDSVSRNFQYGDTLIWDDDINDYVYAVENSSLKIIQRVSAIDSAPTVILKVAKLSSNIPEPLTTPELDAFELYINQRKPAGIFVDVISIVADLLKMNINVRYDALIMTNDGQYINDMGYFPVEDAINAYISNLPFDGVMELCHLVDAIQIVEGVKSVYVNNAQAKSVTSAYSSFSERYQPLAGHLTIDPLFPLNTSINYVANV